MQRYWYRKDKSRGLEDWQVMDGVEVYCIVARLKTAKETAAMLNKREFYRVNADRIAMVAANLVPQYDCQNDWRPAAIVDQATDIVREIVRRGEGDG